MYRATLESPIGPLQLLADDHSLYRIAFACSTNTFPQASPAPAAHPLLSLAALQITEYFKGSRQNFDLPLSAQGTSFQKAAWELMQQIPYGQTRAYGEIAAGLGNPNKARAVGGAANKNPLPLVIPCHRVMGTSGKLTGFAGGLATKQFLLNLEQQRAQPSVKADT